ncbi:hypothetical protein [Nocardioides daejeonensis]|uniref:hypothetical protein n=1 Tax=Nocardioides daejeonensis TaxID=1046556 RepID=UPI000D7406DA|nr:hypothetical protein [Nocardioides daejeonensis]
MNEHDLPAERHLDDHTRARMRAELIAATAPAEERRASWLTPVAASVAILAVVGAGGAFMAMSGNDDPSGGSELSPAAPGASDAETPAEGSTAEATPPESASTDDVITPGETIRASDAKKMLRNRQPMPPSTCAADVPEFLKKASERSAIEYDGGRAGLWSDGATWVVCDTWAADVDGGATTLLGNTALTAPVSKETFKLSQNYAMPGSGSTGAANAQLVAGGPKIPGVTAISYEFRDGHVAQAEITDDMWLMTYLPTSEKFAKEPLGTVTVRVTRASGVTSYTLTGPGDTCAQINHGC